MTDQDKFDSRLKIEHHLNPVNLYSHLVQAGFPEDQAMRAAREYERLLAQSEIFKLLFNPQ